MSGKELGNQPAYPLPDSACVTFTGLTTHQRAAIAAMQGIMSDARTVGCFEQLSRERKTDANTLIGNAAVAAADIVCEALAKEVG